MDFTAPDGAVDFKIEEQQGYDRITFLGSSDASSEDRATHVSVVHEMCGSELGIYYRIIQARNRLNRKWSELTDQIDQLVDDASTGKRWLGIKYWPSWRAKLDSAAFELVRFKLRVDEMVTSNTRRLDELARIEGFDFLRRYSDRELSGARQYAIKDFSEMLALLEKRSHTEATNVTVMVAALLGGIVGAVLTAVLGAALK